MDLLKPFSAQSRAIYWSEHGHHRHLIKLDKLKECTTCLIVNVSYVSGRSKNIVVKAGTFIHLACLPCRPSCLALVYQFVLATTAPSTQCQGFDSSQGNLAEGEGSVQLTSSSR